MDLIWRAVGVKGFGRMVSYRSRGVEGFGIVL